MRLIIGLGNPEERYQKTRHNVGWFILDKLAEKLRVSSFELNKKFLSLITHHSSLILVKPQTYMNESGKAVSKIVNHYKIKMPELWVIHDDLDIPLGSYKIQKGKGPREHKGLLSIYEKLGKKDFWHVRIGIENRENMENRVSGEEYVLQNFTEEEIEIIKKVSDKKVVLELVNQLTQ